jgi:hypothetical protein
MSVLPALALILVAVYILVLAGLFLVMRLPPARFGRVMRYVPRPLMIAMPFPPMWKVARAGRTRVGELAPDFTLPTLDRRRTITLSSFRGVRPVVLVFGSYT